MITRRKLLVQGASTLAVTSLSFGAAGCKKQLSREDVLATLARDVALPNMRALSQVDAQLLRAVAALPPVARAQELAAPRAALAQALLAWERAYVFRSGPLVESNAFLRARFWPTRKSSFHELLLGQEAIDPARVGALGVDVKGLFALERLLWERLTPAEGERLLFEARPERARSLAIALAQDIQLHGERAEKLRGDGSAFVTRFARAGQASVALLVTQLVETVEAIVTDRLARVLGLHQNGRLKLGELIAAAVASPARSTSPARPWQRPRSSARSLRTSFRLRPV
jgi:predicted lipoprotein